MRKSIVDDHRTFQVPGKGCHVAPQGNVSTKIVLSVRPLTKLYSFSHSKSIKTCSVGTWKML